MNDLPQKLADAMKAATANGDVASNGEKFQVWYGLVWYQHFVVIKKP